MWATTYRRLKFDLIVLAFIYLGLLQIISQLSNCAGVNQKGSDGSVVETLHEAYLTSVVH